MAEKRAHPDDDSEDHLNGHKRPRSNNGSPAPITNGSMPSKPSLQDQLAAAKERAAALRASLEGRKPSSPSPVPAPSASSAQRERLDALKARVAAATAKSTVLRTENPVIPAIRQPELDDGPSRARGGLGIGLHPALMADASQDSRTKGRTAVASKFPTTMANRRPDSALSGAKGKKELDISGPTLEELKKNPYFDASIASAAPKSRRSRELIFNPKGKFIAQAAALRRQAHLEEMKKRIAETARRAGLDEDRSEQAFVVAAPPEVEWWDEGLLSTPSYPDFENDAMEAENSLKIETEDTIITRYVQHPVLLPPPMEKTMPAPKPLPLTKSEQKKKRRQDRMEVHKEQQAKIRLGLEPPPPPKVKKSNLMTVLGEQAVKDPTAVEARVNREIAERAQAHIDANEARKLNTEQRHEKLAAKQEADAARGIHCACFRIDSLAYGKHRYQVDVNAKQRKLTGITILHPKVNLVIVEGGQRSMLKYKVLMLNRIKWTEIGPNISAEGHEGGSSGKPNSRDAMNKDWLKPEDESGQLRDMSENKCVLVWEGEEKNRAFKGFRSVVAESDNEARSALTRAKMENMWTLAKNLP